MCGEGAPSQTTRTWQLRNAISAMTGPAGDIIAIDVVARYTHAAIFV